jgi:hypothetical protein
VIPWENEDLPPKGYVRLTPEMQWIPLDPIDARLGDESVVIRLPGMGAVRGRVVDGNTRSPIPGGHASIRQRGQWLQRKTTDAEGRFHFDRVLPEQCMPYVYADGYWPRETEIEVYEEQERYYEVTLQTYYVIRGRLRLKETMQPFVAEIRTKDGNYVSERDGTFAIVVPAEGNMGTMGYGLTVFLGTGLKSVHRYVPHPSAYEVDIGDILIEREEVK